MNTEDWSKVPKNGFFRGTIMARTRHNHVLSDQIRADFWPQEIDVSVHVSWDRLHFVDWKLDIFSSKIHERNLRIIKQLDYRVRVTRVTNVWLIVPHSVRAVR